MTLPSSVLTDLACHGRSSEYWLLVIYIIKVSVPFLYRDVFPDTHNFQIYAISTIVVLACSVAGHLGANGHLAVRLNSCEDYNML